MLKFKRTKEGKYNVVGTELYITGPNHNGMWTLERRDFWDEEIFHFVKNFKDKDRCLVWLMGRLISGVNEYIHSQRKPCPVS